MNVGLDLSRIEGLQEVLSAGLPAIVTGLVQEIESEVAHIEAALTDDDLASAATAAHAARNSALMFGAEPLLETLDASRPRRIAASARWR